MAAVFITQDVNLRDVAFIYIKGFVWCFQKQVNYTKLQ